MTRYLALNAALLGVLAWAAWVCGAVAHEAPSGWLYPGWCCGNTDCTQVRPSSVEVTPQGYRVRLQPGEHDVAPDGFDETVPYGDKRILMSQDEYFHVCILKDGTQRCLFVPLTSY